MAKQLAHIEDLEPDRDNPNEGTERGRYMLETSLEKVGGARSIVVDSEGRIVAGNKIAEVAAEKGLPIRVVDSDGTELVVVRRTDWDLQDPQGQARWYSIMDNRASQVDFALAREALAKHIARGTDVSDMFRDNEIEGLAAVAEHLATAVQEGRPPPLSALAQGDEEEKEEKETRTAAAGSTREERLYHFSFSVPFEDSILIKQAMADYTDDDQSDFLVAAASSKLKGLW